MSGQSYNITINLTSLGNNELLKLSYTLNNLSNKSNVLDGSLNRLGNTAEKTQSNLAAFNGDFNLGNIGNITPTLPFENQINRAIDSIKKKAQSITGINLNANDAKSTIDALKAKLTGLQGQRNLSLNTADIRKANAEIKEVEAEIKKLEGLPPAGIFQRFDRLRSSISPMVGLIAGAFAFDKLIGFGGEVVKVTSEFQKYQAVLTNTFGSEVLANEAMSDLQKLATQTPFQLNNLTESYVKLANRGFIPTMAEMTKLGDLASSTGKDFDQLVEAVLDAETGEMERLKEFGIQADKNKDKVSFTFKGVTKTVKNEASEIRKYLLGLGDLKGVQGSMAAISGTIGGQLSNLQDNFDAFKLKIGKAFEPFIKIGLKVGSKLLELGTMLADKVNPYITELGTFAKQNMPLVKQGLIGVGIALGLVTVGFLALNIAMLANPIFLITTAIIGLVGMFGYWYATSEEVRSVVWGLWEAGKVVFGGLWEIVKSFVSNTWEALKGLGNLLQGIFTLDFEQIKTGFGQLATGVGSFAKDLFTNTVDIGKNIGKAYSEGMKGGLADFAKSQEQNKAFKQNAIEQEIIAGQKQNAEQSLLGEAKNKGFGLAEVAKYNQSGAKEKGIGLSDFLNNKKSGGLSDALPDKGGKGKGIGAGISEIKSDSGTAKNLTIHIQKLVEKVEIHSSTVGESAGRIKEQVTKALLAAVNDVNLAV